MATVNEQWREAQHILAKIESFLPSLQIVCRQTLVALKNGNTLYSCGNGGSAAEALHLAEEFTGRYRKNRLSLPAHCLAADPTAMSCIANDYGFDFVFSRPLEAFAKKGDLLFVFSTSGNSPNILKALEVAKKKEMTSILLSGQSGGKAKALSDFQLLVPSENTARIQEIHQFFVHAILEAVEEIF